MKEPRTLAARIAAFQAEIRALGHDINVSARDGIVSILIPTHCGPGFLGKGRA